MDDWGKTQLHCTNDMLLVCVAGEAWESYKKLNCVRCHGEPPQSLVDIANSKRPMIPRSLMLLQCLFWGRTKWGHRTQRLMLDRGKCNIINTLSLNIAMFV